MDKATATRYSQKCLVCSLCWTGAGRLFCLAVGSPSAGFCGTCVTAGFEDMFSLTGRSTLTWSKKKSELAWTVAGKRSMFLDSTIMFNVTEQEESCSTDLSSSCLDSLDGSNFLLSSLLLLRRGCGSRLLLRLLALHTTQHDFTSVFSRLQDKLKKRPRMKCKFDDKQSPGWLLLPPLQPSSSFSSSF